MPRNIADEAARALLDRARLREDELASRLEKALSSAHWEALSPSLSVENPRGGFIEAAALAPDRVREFGERFATEGYLQTEPILSESAVDRMRECVATLKREEWPPVFAFVYDEFWQVWRAASLVQLLAGGLGPTFRQAPDLWVHYVPSYRRASGWLPHKDYPGREHRLTVWVPLSDATLDTGCICVIPRDLIPPRVSDQWYDLEAFDKADVLALLQSSRALPARAGSVLCWDGGVVHWGSVRHRAGEPRVSVSMEFVGEDVEPTADERPLFDVRSSLPTFAQRLHVIGTVILRYARNEPLMFRYVELARQLLERVGAP